MNKEILLFTGPWNKKWDDNSNRIYYLINEEEYKLLQKAKKEQENRFIIEVQKTFFKLRKNN